MLRSIISACAILLASLVIASVAAPLRPNSAAARQATPSAVCPSTTEDENEALVRRYYDEAWNGQDLAVLDELLASGVVHHSALPPDAEGPEAVKQFIGAILTGFPDATLTIDQVVTEDDVVVIRWHNMGTQLGEFRGIPPTGANVAWSGINVFRIECGQIAEVWAQVGTLEWFRQLGVITDEELTSVEAPAATPAP